MTETTIPLDELPLGEMKAQHHDKHMCFRCVHSIVCRVATAMDPHLLITVTHCLAFDADPEGVGSKG